MLHRVVVCYRNTIAAYVADFVVVVIVAAADVRGIVIVVEVRHRA